MVIIDDVTMPDHCWECNFMRCSKCVAKSSAPVTQFVKEKTKPDWCPIIFEIQFVPDEHMEEVIECLRS